ncbi:hypothetical protein INR49_024924 [Caranx melampygus]|nr:hypothetical protein INR49_024924 [Caranx melampygus]
MGGGEKDVGRQCRQTLNDCVMLKAPPDLGVQLDRREPMEHLDRLEHLEYVQKELETLKKIVDKLELGITYDFVRKVGEKYFVSYKERGTFSRADEFCTQQGLELALPQNKEENVALTQFFGDVCKTAWINVNNQKAVGNFAVDMKNQPLTFTQWGEGQPDKSIQGTGCTMVSENGAWQLTHDCSLNAYIICQI